MTDLAKVQIRLMKVCSRAQPFHDTSTSIVVEPLVETAPEEERVPGGVGQQDVRSSVVGHHDVLSRRTSPGSPP